MINNKKIFIAHSWLEAGVNIQSRAVANKLSENADVIFISQSRIGKPEIIINSHLKVIEWPTKRPNRFKDFIFLIQHIRKEKPEILVAHFGATNLCMAAAWLMRVPFRVAWMHTLSGQYYLDSKNKRAAKLAIMIRTLAYKFANHIIVLNEYARKDAVENFKANPKKITVIYNGIYNIGEKPLENNGRRSIRFCGRLDKSKGIDILLKAFAIAYRDNKNIILEIAGKGSEEENIQAFIKKEQLENAVKLYGYFNQYSEAVKFVGQAYCIAVPSRTDNFPTVIIEAMSQGVPVIASRTGGIQEMLENGKEGFLVRSEDAEELAELIKKLVTDENMRNEMSEQAKQTFNKKFSMEKHINNVIDFMQNLNKKY